MSPNEDKDSWRPEKTGLLTSRDREFLQSDEDRYTGAARKRRERIRQRIRAGLFDFPIIFDHLPAPDLEQIFSPVPDHRRDEDPRGNNRIDDFTSFVMPGAIGFLFQCRYSPADISNLCRYIADPELEEDGYRLPDHPMAFEELAEDGIKRALRKAGWIARVNISIDIDDPVQVSQLAADVWEQDPDEISLRDLRELHEAGELSNAEYNELAAKKREYVEENVERRRRQAEDASSEENGDRED